MTVINEHRLADFSKNELCAEIIRRQWADGSVDYVVIVGNFHSRFGAPEAACADFGAEVASIVENAIKTGRL